MFLTVLAEVKHLCYPKKEPLDTISKHAKNNNSPRQATRISEYRDINSLVSYLFCIMNNGEFAKERLYQIMPSLV